MPSVVRAAQPRPRGRELTSASTPAIGRLSTVFAVEAGTPDPSGADRPRLRSPSRLRGVAGDGRPDDRAAGRARMRPHRRRATAATWPRSASRFARAAVELAACRFAAAWRCSAQRRAAQRPRRLRVAPGRRADLEPRTRRGRGRGAACMRTRAVRHEAGSLRRRPPSRRSASSACSCAGDADRLTVSEEETHGRGRPGRRPARWQADAAIVPEPSGADAVHGGVSGSLLAAVDGRGPGRARRDPGRSTASDERRGQRDRQGTRWCSTRPTGSNAQLGGRASGIRRWRRRDCVRHRDPRRGVDASAYPAGLPDRHATSSTSRSRPATVAGAPRRGASSRPRSRAAAGCGPVAARPPAARRVAPGRRPARPRSPADEPIVRTLQGVQHALFVRRAGRRVRQLERWGPPSSARAGSRPSTSRRATSGSPIRAREHVPAAELVACAQGTALTAMRFCGVAQSM